MGKSSLRLQEELFDYKVFQWHSRGQRFDPAYLHHVKRQSLLLPFFSACARKMLFLSLFCFYNQFGSALNLGLSQNA